MALFAFTLMGCDNKTEPIVEPPQLNITHEGDFQIDPLGGDYSIPYEIINEVDGGQINVSVEEGCDWIVSLNYNTYGNVSFTVPANESGEDRTTVMTIVYTYGEGQTAEDAININQPKYEPVYDYEFEFEYETAFYYGDKFGLNGEHKYYTWLSDMPFDENGYTQPGGTYYLFDLYAPAPEIEENPQLPAGTYTLGEAGLTEEYTFTPDYSMGMTLSEDGEFRTMNVTYSEGTLEVTKEGDNYVFDAVLTDQEGKTHHVTYNGAAIWEDAPLEYIPIKEDMDISATTGLAGMFSADGGTMYVALQLTDMEVGSDGAVVPPGTIVGIEAYMPFDENGYITPGEYEISAEPGDDFTLVRGETAYAFGLVLPKGTYAMYVDEASGFSYGFINSGTMKVSGSDGNYDIEFSFKTEQGYNITGSYSGPLAATEPLFVTESLFNTGISVHSSDEEPIYKSFCMIKQSNM